MQCSIILFNVWIMATKMIVKYKQNKREPRGAIRSRVKNKFTIEYQDKETVKLKSYNTSVTWFEYADINEIEEVK